MLCGISWRNQKGIEKEETGKVNIEKQNQQFSETGVLRFYIRLGKVFFKGCFSNFLIVTSTLYMLFNYKINIERQSLRHKT